jgi:hypothetical protein
MKVSQRENLMDFKLSRHWEVFLNKIKNLIPNWKEQVY